MPSISPRSPQAKDAALTRRPAQQQDAAGSSSVLELVRALARQQAAADHEAERQGK